jgi:hypothetical protein
MYIQSMINANYPDLTITEILELAAGDLDSAELATRLARRSPSRSASAPTAVSVLASRTTWVRSPMSPTRLWELLAK